MRTDFLVKEAGNHRLILIFAGWSTDARFYAGDYPNGWDVLVCHSYTSADLDLPSLRGYHTIYLYAWSLGVAIAPLALQGLDIAAAFAINGSAVPVSDEKGIPTAIYQGTCQGLSPRNLQKFRMRMFPQRSLYEAMLERFPIVDEIASLQRQLEFVESVSGEGWGFSWSRIYISRDDRIFPYQNLQRAWDGHPQVVTLEGGHFVDLPSLVRHTVPDTERVGRRFADACSTYERHASAQALIAERLTELIPAAGFPARKKILEIGCGSGLFSRLYASKLKPAQITYVDLFRPEDFQLAASEEYCVEDGERFFETRTGETWDLIVSASTLQWFANPALWFRQAAEALKEEGMLAFSTFLPGNLWELDTLRPTPLLYRSREYLLQSLSKFFREVRMEEGEIVLRFANVRELLLHLKHTGVGGHSVGTASINEIGTHLPRNGSGHLTLTYRPLYVVAKK